MQKALEQAEKALYEAEVPVGCVFVDNKTGKIVASAHNLTNKTKNATTHCEINCIRELGNGFDFSQCTLYVTVEPCIMCAYALNLIQIKKVVYGCDNDKFGGNASILSLHRNIEKPKDLKYEVVSGVLKQ
mmetsp:Transcript_22277/g.15887  ORF Transcript_22277/g.15887 Transcript_22277/m.15887 type:complete len:130 (+) Transcript_22277:48-437(+)